MKIPLIILSFFVLTTSFSQNMVEIEKLLDSLNIDYHLSPNQIIDNDIYSTNVVWAGRVDTIDILNISNGIQVFFYCQHFDFDTVSNELIGTRQMKLKNVGDGNFIVSILSSEMTLREANDLKTTILRQETFLLTIGEAINLEKRFKKNYVNTVTYKFYTFRK